MLIKAACCPHRVLLEPQFKMKEKAAKGHQATRLPATAYNDPKNHSDLKSSGLPCGPTDAKCTGQESLQMWKANWLWPGTRGWHSGEVRSFGGNETVARLREAVKSHLPLALNG